MKKIIKLLIITVISLTLISCSNKDKLTLYRDTTFNVGFNTPFTLMLYTESQEKFDEYFEIMQETVREYNDLFDIYNNYPGINNIKTINDNAGIEKVEVDPLIIELLLESKKYSDLTNDLFNPTLGSVLTIWHDAREEGKSLNEIGEYGKSPSQEILEEARAHVGWQFVEIDEVNNTVYINNPKTSLDVGAIAKGWAVERVANKMEDLGIEYGIVNGGGNVRLIGSKYNEGPWSVGVTNPDSTKDESIMSLHFAEDMSVVTSGDYERYFIDEDKNQQHHLISPITLQPTRESRSVTITIKDSGVADVLSTAFSMLNLEDAKELENKLNYESLGLIFVKNEKEENDFGYNYLEKDGKHIYYNDKIKDHTK